MVLGIASYGHSFKVQNQGEFSLYSSFEKNSNPLLPADSKLDRDQSAFSIIFFADYAFNYDRRRR